jgi:hypothetical protein
MKSQFDIYFTIHKTQLHITSYTCSKLNGESQIFRSLGNVSFIFIKHSWLNSGNALIELGSKYSVPPPYPEN